LPNNTSMKWEATSKKAFQGCEWILAVFMLFKVLLQYVLIHPSYDLHRDEYLHLDQSQHLAWGFVSVPPFTSWIAWIIRALGNDVFWVKFFPALFGALTVYYAWKMVEELGGKIYSKIIVSLAIIFSAILRINILFQPNSFEVLSWCAFHYYLIRYVKYKRPLTLYVMALILALSFLNKYNVIFLVAGVLPALLISKQRYLLFSRHVLFAGIVFLMMIGPNIHWQLSNGLPFFWHMRELADTQLVNMSRSVFLTEQMLFFLNSFFVLVIACIGSVRYQPFRPYRFILISYLITMVLYTYLKAKGYYAMGLYPVLLAFGATYLGHITTQKVLWRGVAVAVILLAFIPMLRLAFPTEPAWKLAQSKERFSKVRLTRWEDGREHDLPQDFADMLGWRELAYKTDSAYLSLKDREGVLVLTNNYGQAGAINYYTVNSLHAVSFNADYLNWFPLGKPIRHVIRVMEEEEDDDDPNREQERSLCDTLVLAGKVEHPLAREKGTKIWIMKNVNGNLWPVILDEIAQHKKHE